MKQINKLKTDGRMVGVYKRKTTQGSWNEEDMKKAMAESKVSSLAEASRRYNIPLGTLHRHVKKGDATKQLGRFRPVFSQDQERQLAQHAEELDKRFYGLTRESLMELAYSFASQSGIKNPFKNNKAGKSWVNSFMDRNPTLSFRKPEPTSIARCSGFNRRQVGAFYDNLWKIINEENLIERPGDIYNMDETGIQSSANRPPKVLSVRGKRQVGVISSAEKGQLTTVLGCCSASGRFLPPGLIFSHRKNFVQRLLDNGPVGSRGWVSDSGWINSDLFLRWLEFFVENVRPTLDHKVLLIVDNHASHHSLEALDYATNNGIIMLSVPPHTTHKLQPLDVSVYKSFKTSFELAVDKFQKNNPGRRIGQFDVAGLVREAFEKSSTIQNATSGFRKSGIFPFDRTLFNDDDYAPADVHYRPENDVAVPVNDVAVPENDVGVPENDVAVNVIETEVAVPAVEIRRRPNCSRQAHPEVQPIAGPSQPTTAPVRRQLNFTSTTSRPLVPADIMPLPKVGTRPTGSSITQHKRKSRCQKSEILTSSPFKKVIREKAQKISAKLVKKTKGGKTGGMGQKNKHGKVTVASRTARRPKVPNVVTKELPNKDGQENVVCLVCSEVFVDPPTEDWIQCKSCEGWVHELCADVTDTQYVCDLCLT